MSSELKGGRLVEALYEDPPVRLKPGRHGLMMYLDNDLIGRSLDIYGEFSQAELELLSDVLRPGMFVVDVGANIGTHAVFIGKRVGPSGHLVCFEPQRFIFQLLNGNLALNRLNNVKTLHAAAGRSRGALYVPSLDYQAAECFNFGALELGAWATGESVPVITIDSLELDRCDLLKVDVEGMELEALAGAAKTIQRHRPMLHVENNKRDRSPALLAWMIEAGYRCYWRITPYFNPANHFGATEDIFGGAVEINVIAFHRTAGVNVLGLQEIVDPEGWPVG